MVSVEVVGLAVSDSGNKADLGIEMFTHLQVTKSELVGGIVVLQVRGIGVVAALEPRVCVNEAKLNQLANRPRPKLASAPKVRL